MAKEKIDFGEKTKEYHAKLGKEVPVWQSPKYVAAKQKAIEIIESGKYGLTSADFWILMNATKSGKMAYTGLIISHNGCLKINDGLPPEKKFMPDCLVRDKEGYQGSLVYEYNCPQQGLYEVGEVNSKNCQNQYPYAMAFKRCFDRVVLKNCKLAYAGIYSDSESEEFANSESNEAEVPVEAPLANDDQRREVCSLIVKKFGKESAGAELKKLIGREESKGMTMEEYAKCIFALTE